MKTAPCKDCPSRHPGCHGSCETYKSWNEQHWVEKNAIKAEKKKQAIIQSYMVDAVKFTRSPEGRAIGKRKWDAINRSRMEDSQKGATDRPNGPHSD